ncbi:hypothetical protein Patl1_06272 [Pistacia atlantica]|uniref:Uncharacterized protein n=1 Tax=Pistacia atlantica TaxID=434234 RepID=A0ACC1BQN0_9ROSI|nr:hypothetical protein Patl1_06272 [Pistacia atlantica]
MATTTTPPNKLTLKLMIDKGAKKVLFAEAGKDFVDVLFNLLSLKLGTVIKLLRDANMVGCIGNLYPSLENLNKDYLQPNQNKLELLKTQEKTSALLVPGDDLLVTPGSMISSIDLIQEHVKDIGALEKRVVEFGTDEVLELLGTSLQSDAALTSVFLLKKELKDIDVSN